jgi:hypothetical protein
MSLKTTDTKEDLKVEGVYYIEAPVDCFYSRIENPPNVNIKKIKMSVRFDGYIKDRARFFYLNRNTVPEIFRKNYNIYHREDSSKSFFKNVYNAFFDNSEYYELYTNTSEKITIIKEAENLIDLYQKMIQELEKTKNKEIKDTEEKYNIDIKYIAEKVKYKTEEEKNKNISDIRKDLLITISNIKDSYDDKINELKKEYFAKYYKKGGKSKKSKKTKKSKKSKKSKKRKSKK